MAKAEKLKSCESCTAFKKRGRCIGTGVASANIVFLGGAPKHVDVDDTKVVSFGDSVGEFFISVYKKVIASDPDYARVKPYYIHATQCEEADKAEEIKNCSHIVHSQIARTAATIIVPLGSQALKSLGISSPVGKIRGKHLKCNIEGRPYDMVPTYNPGALLRKENVGLLKTMQADIRRALNIAIGQSLKPRSIKELSEAYKIAKTVKEGIEICDEILAYREEGDKIPVLAVDTETTALETWIDTFKIIAISFAWGKGLSAAILLDHRENKEDWTELIPHIRKVLEGPNPKTFHNFKYDYKVLTLSYGWPVAKLSWDSMAGEYILDENKKNLYGLKSIVRTRVPDFTDYEQRIKDQLKGSDNHKDSIEEKTTKKKELDALIKQKVAVKKATDDRELKKSSTLELKSLRADKKVLLDDIKILKAKAKLEKEDAENNTFEDIDVDDMLLYAAIDTDCTRQITLQQVAEVNKEDENLKYVMRNIMLPGAKVLARMEHEGIKVDLEYLDELENNFQTILDVEERAIFGLIGQEINLNSGKQLETLLLSDLGLKLTVRTAKDTQYKLDEKVLKKFLDVHPVILHIMRWKKADKAKHTFLKGIRKKCEYDGRIHANYNNTTTATGRLSSSGPNMQNVPSKGILGFNIKKLFIPDNEDEVFVDMDYSGAEIRVLTAYAKDEGLITSLNDGLSVHSYVASEVFGLDYEEIQTRKKYYETDRERFNFLEGKRQAAKATVFLTIYGGGAQTLYENLKEEDSSITLAQCEGTIRTFLDRFPIIEKYMFNIKRHIDAHGFVKTRFGRRRRFPLAGMDWKLKNDAYREGINAPIQSTSSDLVVFALIVMAAHGEEIDFKPRVTVHDSIGFSMKKIHLDKVVGFLDNYAVDSISKKFSWLPVPFEYEASWGPSYGECTNEIKA